MASNDLGSKIKYAHVIPGWIQGWVIEMKFVIIYSGFGVKRAQTNGQTDTFHNYIPYVGSFFCVLILKVFKRPIVDVFKGL